MTLSNDDWAEIIRHTRARVREAGLRDVDERVMMDFRPMETARADFLGYLDSLISSLAERSSSTCQRALGTFREHVHTESGAPVQGIEVWVEDRDFSMLSTQRIDLCSEPDMNVAIQELKRLRRDLVSMGLFDEQSGT